jgi:hypothetical protein
LLGTWTPAALSSETRRISGICWRVVEGQHVVSTLKLVDTLAEQQLLEEILDASKPPVPPECRHLHYLLATPFRYNAPYPYGSRFRRAGFTPGVFYASATTSTAIAEMAYHRLLFFAESPGTPWPMNPGEFTVFSVRFGTTAGLDLTIPPLDADRGQWTHPTDYTACQDFSDAARAAGAEALRYPSARDASGRNVALLTCHAFRSREPLERQVWRMDVGPGGVRAICEVPHQRLSFDRAAFGDDPRIARK